MSEVAARPARWPQWTARNTVWGGGLLIAVIAALAAHDILQGYRAAVRDAFRELDTNARVIAEQTARSVQAVDVVLRHLRQAFQEGTLASLSEDDLNAYLKDQAVGLVQIEGLLIIHADGTLRGSSYIESDKAPRVNVSDSPLFKAVRADRSGGLVLDKSRRSSIDGRWMFVMGRRLESSSGEFAGGLAARFRIDYFQDFYRDVQLGAGTTITLVHRDGALMARHPAAESSLGQHFPLFSQLAAVDGRSPTEPIRAVSPVDGRERFAAMRLIPDYPLAVFVTRETDAALAAWRSQALGSVARTLALGALAAVLLAALTRQLARLNSARSSLEISQERFAAAVAGSDDGIWDWDYRNGRAFASARAREILAMPAGPETQSIDDWSAAFVRQIHPDDVPRRRAAIKDHLSGKTPAYEAEYRVRGVDGNYRWIQVRGVCTRDGEGRPLRMAGSVSDIDARKRAEQSLRDSEERYALAMRGSRGGHWLWDISSDTLYVSEPLNLLFGQPADLQSLPRGEYFSRVTIHPEDAEAFARIESDIVAGRSTRVDFEYRIVLRDSGEVRWILTRAQAFRDTAEQRPRLAGVTVDISERKQMEIALRQSEERYALAMTGSNEAHWVWDLTNDEIYQSPTLRDLYGIGRDEHLPTRTEFFARIPMHADDREHVNQLWLDHIAGGTERLDVEFRIIDRKTGRIRWIHSRGQCFRDASGKALRVAGATVEVSERKYAEEALRVSEQRFALAVEGSNDGIIDWDIVDDRMFTSKRAMQIAGIDSDVTVRTRAEWVALLRLHPDDKVRHEEDLRRNLEGHTEVREGEYRVQQADGSYRWVRLRGKWIRDADGHPLRWAGSVSDIDAQKRTEMALRESQERYQLAVAGSNEGLWDWDLATDRLFLSPRAQQFLGFEPGEPEQPRREWIGRTTYHPDDIDLVRAATRAHLRGDTALFEVEYRMKYRDGAWHWYRQRGVALRDGNGRPYRMAGSMEDISRRKNAEAERDRLESQLRQAQKLEAIGTLAGGIAHDFNNILAAILGYGELVQKDAAEGTALRRHIDAAMSAGLRAKSLVERILAFSRSGMGERVPVHVQSVVAEALDAVAGSLPHGVQLERELAAGDAAVLGDPTQIHQVVMNLCANAVQAMKSEGRLGVAVAVRELAAPRLVATSRLALGRYVCVTVCDSGSGIPPAVLERIFDPFFTTKEAGVGTGLGLSLVHGIVTDLGGGIEVDSRLGAGSTFTVYLPWHGQAEAVQRVDERVVNGAGETVLLVDDEEPLVRLGEEMLAELGYEPVGFASSVAALESFRAAPQRFNIVLSDEAMPGMTGSELVAEIRRIRPDIPILMMSGFVSPALAARAREAGVIEVLAKPLVSREIARSLAGALRQQELVRE